MVGQEEIRLSYSDGYEGFARLWLPASPRGAVLYLHGIQSHGLWFENSAQRMADAGFAVLLPDRRGSGRNQHDRGHASSPDRLMSDLADCCKLLQERSGLERLHVVGVSWGGKLALNLCNTLPQRIQSVALVAPGLFASVDIPFTQKTKVAMAVLLSGRNLFDIPLQDPELFTANPARQEFIRTDELALRQVTARFLVTSRRLDGMARRAGKRPSGPPLCLFLAERDRIINNHATREFVRSLKWPGRRIVEYRNAQHTLEFETDPEPFLDDLVSWLKTNSSERGGADKVAVELSAVSQTCHRNLREK